MTNDPNDEMLRATRESQGQPMDAVSSSPEGRQEAAVLDAKQDREELEAICKELGCVNKPGVALKFAKQARDDIAKQYARNVELIASWDEASPTERQELDGLRRGWGPSTPTERMARRTDLVEAMHVISRAMDAVLPDDKEDDELTADHFQTAYDKLNEGYRAIIGLLHALPELNDPDIPAAIIPAKPAVEVVEALLIRWAHDTLYEINPDNYDHAEVCKLNDASVEVILGLAQYLGERHGKTEEWWRDYTAKHLIAALQAPATPDAQTEVEK